MAELAYSPGGGRLKIDVLVVLANANSGDTGVLLSVRRNGTEIDNFPLIARATFATPWTPFTFDPNALSGEDVTYSLWGEVPDAPGADTCTVTRARIAIDEFKR